MRYTRNPAAVLEQLKVSAAGQVITRAYCKIQVPARYMDIGLGQIGAETFTLGCFALILEDGNYTVCNITSIVELNPFKTLTTTIDEVLYYEFYFEPGQVVIPTVDVLRRSDIMYNIFDEFMFKGKVPWYLNYEDLGKLFDTAKSHGDSNVGESLETIELIASMITRHVKDRTKPIRQVLQDYKELIPANVDYVGLNSIFYSVNSTLNKLAGSYFTDGVSSALVTPTDNVSTIESILRA